ncbi:MAG: TIGR00730 family Rossman fold protein [Phycisphaerales bacterium]|nr:TIGR00730 family Rossman fold protein [Phycisphaerales bacterium]
MNLDGAGIAVFCSSSEGAAEGFRRATAELAAALAQRRAVVIYGGASVGLMGVLADAALAALGRVVGVIPHQLAEKEIAHAGLTELVIVHTMHERKTIMSQRAAGYIVLPGGFGTYEEFLEVVTWKQLALHAKPIILVNLDGFYDPLLAQVDRAIREQLIKPAYRGLFDVAANVPQALALLDRAEPRLSTGEGKWF